MLVLHLGDHLAKRDIFEAGDDLHLPRICDVDGFVDAAAAEAAHEGVTPVNEDALDEFDAGVHSSDLGRPFGVGDVDRDEFS